MSARSDLHEAVCGDGCGVPSRCARTNRLIDAYAHQLAEQQRAWGEDGEKRLAVDEYGAPLHRSPFYMSEDADTAAGLIDPEVQR